MDRIKNITISIFIAFSMALLYISSLFLVDMIFFRSSVWAIMFSAVTAMVYGFYMVSKNKLFCLLKWGLSIPFSYIVIKWFWSVNFSVRAIYWLDPEYGNLSGGSAFASGSMLMVLSFLFLLNGIIGAVIGQEMIVKLRGTDTGFELIQVVTAVVISIVIIIIAISLEGVFPPYETVVRYS